MIAGNRRFRRKNFKRRDTVAIVPFRKKAPSNKSLNKKVKKIQDMIELKYVDNFFNATVDNTASDFIVLNGVGQGGAANTRIGNECWATSLQFRGKAIASDIALDRETTCRMIVFWDRQANSAAPTITGSTAGGLLNNSVITELVLAPFAYEQNERYRVLYDKRFTLKPRVATAESTGTVDNVLAPVVNFKKKIKLGRKVKYDDTGSTIGAISSNSLYVVLMSDRSAELPTMQVGFRYYFKDA